MSFQFILFFSMTVFVASIIPGPSMLLALTHGMQYGAKRALASALGNVTVTLLQAGVSIAGLGAVLIASEAVFQLVKWAGAAYLVYMGIGLWRSAKLTLAPKDASAKPSARMGLKKMFLQAAFVTAGNPKAIVFFSAVFPQFINPDIAYLPQSIMLMSMGALIAFACFMIYAIGGQKMVSLFSKVAFGRYVNRIIGGTFIGAGIGLAASSR